MSRTKAPDEVKPENHERWIVSYADMVTLLFALFVVLYATSDANPVKLTQVRTSINQAFDAGILKGASGASPISDSGAGISPSMLDLQASALTSITKTVGDFAQKSNLQNSIQVRSDVHSITISMSDNLLFDSGEATLKPGSQAALTEMAQILKGLPNTIRVEGHTDNVPVNSPDYPTNWELSAARASTVLRFLIDAGVPANRMYMAGYADTKPVADNSTLEGRALNRRADIVIVYPTQADLQQTLTPTRKNP